MDVRKLAGAICRRHRDRDPAGGESTFYTGVGILAAAQGGQCLEDTGRSPSVPEHSH